MNDGVKVKLWKPFRQTAKSSERFRLLLLLLSFIYSFEKKNLITSLFHNSGAQLVFCTRSAAS